MKAPAKLPMKLGDLMPGQVALGWDDDQHAVIVSWCDNNGRIEHIVVSGERATCSGPGSSGAGCPNPPMPNGKLCVHCERRAAPIIKVTTGEAVRVDLGRDGESADQWRVRLLLEESRALATRLVQAKEERDAARAEVARLRAVLVDLGPYTHQAVCMSRVSRACACNCGVAEHNAKIRAALEGP